MRSVSALLLTAALALTGLYNAENKKNELLINSILPRVYHSQCSLSSQH